MRKFPKFAKAYIGAIVLAGSLLFTTSLANWETTDFWEFLFYLFLATLASTRKIPLPGVTGTMSVNHVVFLIVIAELSLSEALVIAAVGTIVQMFWRAETNPTAVQMAFNIACVILAVGNAVVYYQSEMLANLVTWQPFRHGIAACLFFVVNTLSVAFVIGLTERRHPLRIWRDCYFWSFPYYLLGASLGAGAVLAGETAGWYVVILFIPVVAIVYRTYQVYLDKLESQKDHAEDIASLHLRTIEALAMAIEAKDAGTHEHLERVQIFVREIGKEFRLEEEELQALVAASILHDIGKLAVPEQIINKPGKLTPEEFEKMKIHPSVGAQILERVEFPYPVAPIVRAHHEKWDGSGYPDGLKGEGIPLGARILAAVDCLDAMASDRPYRRALPLNEAMDYIVSQSGKSYDPKVVDILQAKYEDLAYASSQIGRTLERLATNLSIANGKAPAAGFELPAGAPAERAVARPDFLNSIAAARQEVQALFEITQELGNSLRLDETISMLERRMKKLVDFDSQAVYRLNKDTLTAAYVNGVDSALFGRLEIPRGEGLSGWVADSGKPITNGKPSVEFGYLDDPSLFSNLHSALAVPLKGTEGTVGVLTIYRREQNAFSKEDLRLMTAISSKLAITFENAIEFENVRTSANSDSLTGLPNAKSLFVHLDNELERARRTTTDLTVVVCDLDGFKQVNDAYGHLAGNRVLTEVSAAFRRHCRKYDYVARMGGDEFVFVFYSMSPETARIRMRELEAEVREVGHAVCQQEVLSASFGLAVYPADGAEAEELLAEADRRMYQVKRWRKVTAHTAGELNNMDSLSRVVQ